MSEHFIQCFITLFHKRLTMPLITARLCDFLLTFPGVEYEGIRLPKRDFYEQFIEQTGAKVNWRQVFSSLEMLKPYGLFEISVGKHELSFRFTCTPVGVKEMKREFGQIETELAGKIINSRMTEKSIAKRREELRRQVEEMKDRE